ncbi:hypothetical protein SAMN04515674_101489 [Pseudarcicella hirudinis]|uniref:Uncharacterized protein n=1 Tax=Pseudarcicella hirudinis TaxID=1079859 RepID=A0A1I5MX81_9BACT|nr:hypothetical protein [Pseudarcicella hirudinis]SFP14083.1 hypothetical protein SAMN04515674_101489 [Pseudarcicella hirudinis]
MLEAQFEIAGALLPLLQAGTVKQFDLDKGQLEDPDKYESILQVSVLLGGLDIDFQGSHVGNAQTGAGSFTLKTIFRLPETTYITSKVDDLQRLADNFAALWVAKEVHKAVCKLPTVARHGYREYSVNTFYVVEQTYRSQFWDTINTPQTITLHDFTINVNIPIL